jgi:hypothetical protein
MDYNFNRTVVRCFINTLKLNLLEKQKTQKTKNKTKQNKTKNKNKTKQTKKAKQINKKKEPKFKSKLALMK